jgi:hypothetical protein
MISGIASWKFGYNFFNNPWTNYKTTYPDEDILKAAADFLMILLIEVLSKSAMKSST